jgi:hypothetical protein
MLIEFQIGVAKLHALLLNRNPRGRRSASPMSLRWVVKL